MRERHRLTTAVVHGWLGPMSPCVIASVLWCVVVFSLPRVASLALLCLPCVCVARCPHQPYSGPVHGDAVSGGRVCEMRGRGESEMARCSLKW